MRLWSKNARFFMCHPFYSTSRRTGHAETDEPIFSMTLSLSSGLDFGDARKFVLPSPWPASIDHRPVALVRRGRAGSGPTACSKDCGSPRCFGQDRSASTWPRSRHGGWRDRCPHPRPTTPPAGVKPRTGNWPRAWPACLACPALHLPNRDHIEEAPSNPPRGFHNALHAGEPPISRSSSQINRRLHHRTRATVKLDGGARRNRKAS